MNTKQTVNMRSVFGIIALAAAASAAPYTTQLIPNNYIVVFKESVPKASVEALKANLVQEHEMSTSSMEGPKRSFHIGGFKGFSGEFDSKTLKKLRSNPDVAYIQQDGVVHTMGTQENAPWGLGRISHDKIAEGMPEKPTTFGNYDFDDGAQGEGVNVYVIDTGVYAEHDDFEGRATFAKNFAGDGKDSDCNGHGTHCAGTVAGKTYGVAKKANIIGVKVLTCGGSGSYSGVIAGIDYVANEHDKTKKCVASMSLGGGKNDAVNEAVDNASKAGCIFAIAAGNENQDAKNVSPASAASAITVGSINWKDARSSFSNYGETLSVFAPGENVLSAWIGAKDKT